MPSRAVAVLVPATFVVIWSTGFVMARLVAPYADPLTFLTIRFTLASMVMAATAFLVGSSWPRSATQWRQAAVAGLLMQGCYLAGVFWAVSHGLPAAISALVTGAQPLLTAALARPLLGERVSGRRWLGIAIGSAGIALVILPRLGPGDEITPLPLGAACFGTLAVTAGTIWQKVSGGGRDVAPDAAIQFAAAAPLMLVLALLTESGRIEPTPAFWFGLLWAVFGLSLGAITLLLHMLRTGAVVGVSSLVFLVPPTTAVMSFAAFGETLTPLQLAGMAVAAAGLLLATRP